MDLPKRIIFILTLLMAAALLFTRLGHYALWDDEAVTSLTAKNVMVTGDTGVAVENGNLMLYNSGFLLHNLHDRSSPPLATYCIALSFAVFGKDAWSARLPFVLFGLATIALALWWVRKQSTTVFTLVAMGFLCNVTLILLFRQCRYYAPSTFFTLLVVYIYYHWRGGLRPLFWMALASIGLFAANYLNCVVLYGCLALDYWFWKRKETPMGLKEWSCLILPQAVISGALALIWNPMKTGEGSYAFADNALKKIYLILVSFRDLNVCEYYILMTLVAAIYFGFFSKKDRWLLRASMALYAYIVILSILSPQQIALRGVTDVRYYGPMVPLGIALSVGVICCVARWFQKISSSQRLACVLALVLGFLLFATNLFNGNLMKRPSTILAYLGELASPPPEPYTPTAAWINEHVPKGKTIFVLPDYMVYPLMFHAPHALYAWQIRDRSDPQFKDMPPVHFEGEINPDYMIAFGPKAEQRMELRHESLRKNNADYRLVASIDVFWKDMYRPELFWRTFTPIKRDPTQKTAIYIYKRM